MLLYELIENINDNAVVDIYSAETGEVIATYDGKDSIPEEYNDYTVYDIYANENVICVEIGEE